MRSSDLNYCVIMSDSQIKSKSTTIQGYLGKLQKDIETFINSNPGVDDLAFKYFSDGIYDSFLQIAFRAQETEILGAYSLIKQIVEVYKHIYLRTQSATASFYYGQLNGLYQLYERNYNYSVFKQEMAILPVCKVLRRSLDDFEIVIDHAEDIKESLERLYFHKIIILKNTGKISLRLTSMGKNCFFKLHRENKFIYSNWIYHITTNNTTSGQEKLQQNLSLTEGAHYD